MVFFCLAWPGPRWLMWQRTWLREAVHCVDGLLHPLISWRECARMIDSPTFICSLCFAEMCGWVGLPEWWGNVFQLLDGSPQQRKLLHSYKNRLEFDCKKKKKVSAEKNVICSQLENYFNARWKLSFHCPKVQIGSVFKMCIFVSFNILILASFFF